LQAFGHVRAHSIDETVFLLAGHGEAGRVLSGGTDLLPQLKEGRRRVALVVDVKHIPELNELCYDPQAGLWFGAAVPCYRIVHNPAITHAYPGLVDAAGLIGGIQIQGRATLGGNLCNASPAADSIPALIVHNAVCRVAGPQGRRDVPVEAFCTGPGRTVLEDGELLVAFHLPATQPGFGAAYLRFIPRNEMDIAVAGAAASVQLAADGKTFQAARIALAAVAPTPLLVKEAGNALVGHTITDERAIEEAARLAREAARPINDLRGTAAQRKHLAAVLTRRGLRIAIDRAVAGLDARLLRVDRNSKGL
jgi:carbon-monoxide dehydrogenase medium subunit